MSFRRGDALPDGGTPSYTAGRRSAPRTNSIRCWFTSIPIRTDRLVSYRGMRGMAPRAISRRCIASAVVGVRKPVPRTRVHAMKIRLGRAGHRRRYQLRTHVGTLGFGQSTQARGVRECLLRGAGRW